MNILLIGGSGFIGAAIARRLAAAGHDVTIPSRRPERAAPLRVLPTVEVIAADVHDPARLAALMQGRDAVINLVGILRGDFQRVHVDLPRAIASAASNAGVRRLLHMSALGAAADGPSAYLRSKAAGEAAVRNVADARQGQLDVTVFRPSVVFGDGDHFLNLFAGLLAVAPLLPLACPAARFQPVWVEDVAACFVAALGRRDSIGQCYELAGPTVYTLAELVRYAGRVSGHPRPLIGLPDSLSYLQALLMELVPGGPMTRDNYLSMQVPNVASAAPLPFDLRPTALEAVAPAYLGTALPRRRFTAYCRRARR